MKLKTYRSRGLNPIPLIGLVLAWFVLTTSIADTDVSENPLPTLGTAESSDSSFAGGVSVDGKDYQKSVVKDITSYMDITGNITVAPEHVDQVVDIMVYGDYKPLPPPVVEPFHFMLDSNGEVLAWDKKTTTLVPFQSTIPLKPIQSVPIYRGHITASGLLNVGFAYRLPDETLVASPEKITAKIEPSHYATLDVRTGIMHIPAIKVTNELGEVSVFKANLLAVNKDSSAFQLLDVALLKENIKEVHASYDPKTETAQLSGVYVLAETETQSFMQTLTRDPDKGWFAISDKTQLPYFPGISQPIMTTANAAQIVWLPVTSSLTSEINYEIHLSQIADFEPSDETLYATVVDQTHAEVTGLNDSTLYYVLIVAVDQQGNRSLERVYHHFETLAPPKVAGFSSKPAPGDVINFYKSFVDMPGVGQFIKVAETGESPLTVDLVKIAGEHASDFKIISPEFPFTIEEGSSRNTIKVQCFASDTGLRTANLLLSSNDPLSPLVDYTLECHGVPFTEPSHEFILMPKYGSTPAPDSTLAVSEVDSTNMVFSKTITIAEKGDADLTITGYSFVGTDADYFSLLSPAFPFTIADGGEAQTITVQCSPSSTELRTAQLEMSSNDPAESVVEYSLECRQMPPPSFPGMSQPITTTDNTAQIEWLPATSIFAFEITYEIHLSQIADFEPSDETLYATVVDETQVELTGLNDSSLYYVLIVAVDKQGNRSLERVYHPFETLTPPKFAGFSSQPVPGEKVIFGDSFVGMPSAEQEIKVAETGELPLTVDFVEMTGEHASDFKVISPDFPFTIDEGGSENTIKVQCFASDTELRTANLQLSSNDPLWLKVNYTLECNGLVPKVAGFSSEPAPGEIVIFDNSFVGMPGAEQVIKVAETGEIPLTVDFVEITGTHASDFNIISPQFPFTIEEGGNENTIKVQCFASDTGLRTANLQLSSNDPLLPEINYTLECHGVPMPAPEYSSTPAPGSTLQFMNDVDNPSPVFSQTITITEEGNADLTMSSYSIEGAYANYFRVLSPDFPMTIVDGGDAQTLTVECIPSSYTFVRTAKLTISTNDPAKSVVEYNLECYSPLALVHPQKGYSVSLAPDAKQTWKIPTQFLGSVSVADGEDVTKGIATHFQKVSVWAKIDVEAAHVGQKADLLFVIGMEPQPAPYDEGIDTTYNSVSSSNEFHSLNWYIPSDEQQLVEMYVPAEGWQPELITAFRHNVTLEESMQETFWRGTLEKPGMYHFWVGYRLESGEIIYNPMPIRLEVRAGEQPYFPGVVQIVSTDVDSASLAWLPATDNKTPAESIRYEVHLSDKPGFEPMGNTWHTSVTGVNQVELEDLTTATSYSVLVVAVDADGNRSKERDYRTVTTFNQPVVVSTTTQFAEDKQLGLGDATTEDGTVFTYPSGGEGVQPEVGSVLFANVGEDVYLRKVDSVENTAQGLVVHTSEAELAEVLETGTIDTQLNLFDINEAASRSSTKAGLRTSRSSRRDGTERHVIRWQNDLLVAEQIDYVGYHGNRVRKSSEKADVKASVTFEPKLDTKVAWEIKGWFPPKFTLNEARIIASGKLTAEIGATYNFKASGSVKKEIKLFKKTYRTKYVVGGVPVFQDTTLSVKAVLSANASAKIKAEAVAKAIASVKFGIQWNPEKESWEYIKEPGFSKSFTADISVHGKVVGEVRLIPNIEVKFYQSLAGNLSIEPFLTNTIAAETIGHADILENWGYLKTQLTQFDVALQAEAYASASLDLIFKEFQLLKKTKIWTSSKWVLFSLPKLSLKGASGKVGESITLTATTKNGENNRFDEGSIDWDVTPDKATVSGGKTGTFQSDEEGTYTVFFSGCGRNLPCKLGRQFTSAEVKVEPEEEEPEEPEEPEKPEGGDGTSNGDPHLYTFDNLAYDFQAVGEFILAKSIVPNDSFEVQVRQKAWKTRTDVAITQATAMNVAGDKVGFYIGQEPVTRINGIQVELSDGSISLPQGGSIVKHGQRYSVVWPNGNGLVEVKDNNWGFLVTTYISNAQRGQVIGLLGNADGNPQNDVVMRDGTNLGTSLSFETLYPKYADSWRVAQQESLFDYAPGETTETFTDRDFPSILSKSTGLDEATRAAAEKICQEAGITNPLLMEDCILDVGLTGEEGFAQIPPDLAVPQATVEVAEPPPPTLETPGFGQLTGTVYDAITKQAINGAQVKLTLNGTPQLGTTIEPTANGVYETNVIPSNSGYRLEIEADGYVPEQVFGISVPDGELKEVDAVNLVPVASEGMGQITGTVKNALNNANIPNLYGYAYRYINNSSDMAKRIYTDQNGVFNLEDLSAGNYTLKFYGYMLGLDSEKEYVYMSSNQTTALSIGGQTTDAEVLITPRLYSSFYIVLNWNEVPYDLDAHLTGPNRQDGRFHIYFANQQEPSARLAHDDRDGLGPEVISIGGLPSGGVYRFSVHDYKNGGSASSAALASSGATVEVYSRRNDGLVNRFEVPDQEGTLWTVFEIDESGEVKPVNTMGYEVNQGGIRSRARSARANSVATDYWPIVFQATK